MNLLQTEFLNGIFGDPALFVWNEMGKDALLVDCGDLSRFSTKKLLKVNAIFLSHCHMDHFFGFDTFLRVHLGTHKTVFIFGPPNTSARVLGRLQGYTWNLLDKDLTQFVVIDLDPSSLKKTTTHFRAHDHFLPSETVTEAWEASSPIYSTGNYFVKTVLLDHRTPSLAYAIEEQPSFTVNAPRALELSFKMGPWINRVKKSVFEGKTEKKSVEVPLLDGTFRNFEVTWLKSEIFVQRPPYKIVYVTDGAASAENQQALFPLIHNADLMFSETCFLPADQKLADQTKHFTTEFVAQLAEEAGVKKLAPFHFSKRYMDCSEEVFASISEHFHGLLFDNRQQHQAEINPGRQSNKDCN